MCVNPQFYGDATADAASIAAIPEFAVACIVNAWSPVHVPVMGGRKDAAIYCKALAWGRRGAVHAGKDASHVSRGRRRFEERRNSIAADMPFSNPLLVSQVGLRELKIDPLNSDLLEIVADRHIQPVDLDVVATASCHI